MISGSLVMRFATDFHSFFTHEIIGKSHHSWPQNRYSQLLMHYSLYLNCEWKFISKMYSNFLQDLVVFVEKTSDTVLAFLRNVRCVGWVIPTSLSHWFLRDVGVTWRVQISIWCTFWVFFVLYLPWNIASQRILQTPHWLKVIVRSSDGLELSGIKPLPEPIPSQFYVILNLNTLMMETLFIE